jgi:hypothetical protein
MENECFPSLFEEGWIRPQFCCNALSAGGDGVVGLIRSNHLPQIHEIDRLCRIVNLITWIWVLLLNQEEKFLRYL